jgi:1,4-alpha-glucan branching enzyme
MSNKTEIDRYLFHRGEHKRTYEYMGAHLTKKGTFFRVWAPRAKSVSVIGNFNNWNSSANPMSKVNNEGIWELEIDEIDKGEIYKFDIETQFGERIQKSDPYAFYSELRPNTASVVYGLEKYKWKDSKWLTKRKNTNHYESPMNIYELHLGSWKQKKLPEDKVKDIDHSSNIIEVDHECFYNYREIADELSKYVKYMGYTHIEIMPVSEYPLDASWGYQGTGYYSVTSRYGTPEDFKYFVDKMHEKNIGVILDWVPGHFCKDSHALYRFDGTPTYEYQWELLGENYDWGTANFDLSRNEVKSFLISNALYWIREFHIDGLRIDAVANMIYLDYGKKGDHPELKNEYGGNENLWAVEFLRELNKSILEEYPGVYIAAEESTAWPLVTKPGYVGGLGFTYKWNMGWMNDMLAYIELDPLYRKWHHNYITFSFMYAFSENYVLPLSHDEVVHGKKSLLDKMPGTYEEKFSNLRAFYGYTMLHPGKKLLFMGGEFGQFVEWRYYEDLDWNLLEYQKHKEMKKYTRALNLFYKKEKALWENDCSHEGFQWIDCLNYQESIISFIRKSKDEDDYIIGVFNFTPVPKTGYRIGVPRFAVYEEVFNSDLHEYGGTGMTNKGELHPSLEPWHDMKFSITIDIPPLSAVFYKAQLNKRGKSNG